MFEILYSLVLVFLLMRFKNVAIYKGKKQEVLLLKWAQSANYFSSQQFLAPSILDSSSSKGWTSLFSS